MPGLHLSAIEWMILYLRSDCSEPVSLAPVPSPGLSLSKSPEAMLGVLGERLGMVRERFFDNLLVFNDLLLLQLSSLLASLYRSMQASAKSSFPTCITAASFGFSKASSEFRGRDILQLFASRHLKGLPYVAFTDAIVARMVDAKFRPAGMLAVIKKIMPS
jgi:hypothetical protein